MYLILLAGLLVVGTGAFGHDVGGVAPEDPRLPQPVVATTTTTTTAATVQRSNEVAQALPTRPVDVPADPYAAEPLVEIGTIEIPKIGLNHRIFHGISLRSIDRGPSHWPGSAMPGETGNAVFAGHRVTHSKPFRNLDQLVPGDQVLFTVGGLRSIYVVTGHEIVTPKSMDIVDPTPTPTATLFACHPPGSARFRYVVHLALSSRPV